MIKLIQGDCLEVMKKIEENSVDSIVTDPPYGLSFMGKKWDYDVPSVEIWKECLRVLKPGGYLLSFAGTRTQHRMAVNIEDAGFEIRDMIAWIYGSGFPKSHNISKAIDKAAGVERVEAENDSSVGKKRILDITSPTTTEAKQWDGWGTALKPALEPITVARKPLSEKTVAKNVLKWGTAGINIDDCRVGTEKLPEIKAGQAKLGTFERTNMITPEREGRWPANLIHDGSDEVLELFPNTKSGNNKKYSGYDNKFDNAMFDVGEGNTERVRVIADKGSAARFFKECKEETWHDQNQTQLTVNFVERNLFLQNVVEDSVLNLVAIRDNSEDSPLRNMIQPFMNVMRSELNKNEEINIKTIRSIGKKCLHELKHTITEMLNHSPVKFVETQKLINTMMTIQNLMNIAGFAENIISNSMLRSMVLGEKVSRIKYCAKASKKERNFGCNSIKEKVTQHDGRKTEIENPYQRNKSSINNNNHPTVKPIALMKYLCRLVTPPNGIVLDPFMGSGSTGKAAKSEGFSFIGIELDEHYFEIANRRIKSRRKIIERNK